MNTKRMLSWMLVLFMAVSFLPQSRAEVYAEEAAEIAAESTEAADPAGGSEVLPAQTQPADLTAPEAAGGVTGPGQSDAPAAEVAQVVEPEPEIIGALEAGDAAGAAYGTGSSELSASVETGGMGGTEAPAAQTDLPADDGDAAEAEPAEELLQGVKKIQTIKATCATVDFDHIQLGDEYSWYTYKNNTIKFDVTEGKPAYFAVTGSGSWQRLKDGGNSSDREDWEWKNSGQFTPGKWRYTCQVRVDDEDAKSYCLDEQENVAVRVNGTKWTNSTNPGTMSQPSVYSMLWVYSPIIQLDAPSSGFVFLRDESFTIDRSVVGEAIPSYSLKSGIFGAVDPKYITFEKGSGPDWIQVSADGTVSGTPVKAGTNADLVVRARGSFDVVKSITIPVEDTRTPVSNVKATSNTSAVLAAGKPVKLPTFTVTAGKPARFGELQWQKQNADGTWPSTGVTGGNFTAGTWRLAGKLEITSEDYSAYTHVLKSKVSLQVDGKAWTVSDPPVDTRMRSYVEIVSPPVTIKDAVQVTGVTVSPTSVSMGPGQTKTLTATVSPSNAANKKVTWSSSDTAVVTVDANGRITAKKGGKAAITVTTAQGNKKAVCNVQVIEKVPVVSYRTHVQNVGWQGYVKDGEMSGTTGKSLRLEGINIKISNLPYSGGITYRTHVQNIGWQNWVSDDAMAGTSGRSLRLEGIQIQLTGEIAKYYNVFYQTHVQNIGWTGWAQNGEMCGSAGYAYRLEGIRIKLVKKGNAAPGSTSNVFHLKPGSSTEPVSRTSGAVLGYNTHVQDYGWQNYAYDGGMAGTSGQSKRLEGIHIKLIDKPCSGDIVYRTHVQNIGWQGWKKNGEMSGTSGRSLRLEGIQIYLTGDLAKKYDVYYCVHAQDYGWLGWSKNGVMAGTSGLSKRLEGIKIVLVAKGGKAPAPVGSISGGYVCGGGSKLPDNPYKGS